MNFSVFRMATNNGTAGRSEIIVRYRECQRNHAAPVMLYAVDGCCNFTPAGEDGTPEAFLCEACSCHRSFHRKEEWEPSPVYHYPPTTRYRLTTTVTFPPPPLPPLPPLSAPLPQPYIAPYNDLPPDEVEAEGLNGGEIIEEVGTRKKKGRTRLTPEQKEQMRVFADKLSWRARKHDEEEIRLFCVDIGITPQVFKNWINNNRHRVESGQPSSTPNT